MKFNEKLLELRKQKGLSQEELSYKLDVARQTISKWESGTTTPDFDNLIKLSKIFEISIDEFVGNDFVKVDEEAVKGESRIEDTKQKSKINKSIKIIWSLIFIILAIFAIIFVVKVVQRYKIVDEISKRLVSTYSYSENEIKEYMFTKDIEVLENLLPVKCTGEVIYRKGDVLRKDYYDSNVNFNKKENTGELIRIEYRDKEYYYDIDMVNKTYKKQIYEQGTLYFYNLSGIELNSEIINAYNFNTFGIEDIKNKLLIALNFNNTIEYNNDQIWNYKNYVINNYGDRNTKIDTIAIQVDESKEEPLIIFHKTKGKEESQINYESYMYMWRAKEITDEQIALPDLSEFTLIE